MKHSRASTGSTLALALATLCLPSIAFGACQEVRDRIAQNIESNGVEPMGYSLEVIPTADADQAEGQIVGHCNNNQYQIVYQRYYRTSSAETMEDAADEDDINDASPDTRENDASGMSERSSSESNVSEPSAPGQTDGATGSDGRRIETTDMPVGAASS
ncbi:DUF1161 domain-containing protein [Kushneria sp. AK178]